MATAIAPLPETDEQEKWGGDGFPDLPMELQTALKSLLRKALQRELYARRQEVMEARRQRFYDRGVQYIYWDFSSWGFAPLSSTGSGNPNQESSYEDVYNIYHPFLRALCASLTANSPGAHVEPRTNRTADTVASEDADKYREFLEQANDIKQVQLDVARLQCTDGRIIIEVQKAPPDIKFGVDEKGEPLDAEILDINGVLESKVPITQNDPRKWAYCVLSKEFETEILQEEYPDATTKDGTSAIRDSGSSSGESAYERMARIGVLQGTRLITASGETWSNLVTRHVAYFRPAFFRAESKAIREQLTEAFPDGCRLVVCGDAYCSSENVSMDARLAVGHATPGDGQNRSSLMKDMVGPQDTFNDLWNQQKEIFDYCIPEVYMDTMSLDALAREERQAQPGAEIPVVLAPGESIAQKVLFGQNVEVPATLVQALNVLSGVLAQLITGMYNVAMGAGDENQETAKGLTILKESSLGQVGIAWGYSQRLIAQGLELAIRYAADTRDEDEKIPVKIAGNDSDSDQFIEMRNIKTGNYFCEVDTSYPDTRSMKRAILTSLMESAAKVPFLAALWQLPENQNLFQEYTGIDELEIPGAQAARQQRRETEELLESAPQMPSPEAVQQAIVGMAQKAAQTMQPGMPPPPPPDPAMVAKSLAQPTVPIDPEWDNHQAHIQDITDWLASQDRYDEEAKGNTEGIENVKLHGEAHKKALAAQQANAPNPNQKPPSASINWADLPPDGQVQMAAEAGIKLNPAGVIQQHIEKAAPKPTQGAQHAT